MAAPTTPAEQSYVGEATSGEVPYNGFILGAIAPNLIVIQWGDE